MESKVVKIKKYFNDVTFEEEGHKYTVAGEKLAYSVSTLVHRFEKKTDFDSISYKKDKKFKLPHGSHKMLWKLNAEYACAKGSKAHYFGELYAFCRELEPTSGYEEAMVKFYASLPPHIIVVFTELTMYHKLKMFGGTADIILYNTLTGKFIIADWKTNKDLFKNFAGNMLINEFNFLLDNNFNKYQIQFSTYQVLFEQSGFEVEDRVLIWVKEDGTFDAFSTENYTDIIKEYLK